MPRPRKTIEQVQGDQSPKAPKQRRQAKHVTQEMVEALVNLINAPLAFIAPDYALTEVEGTALVVAITDLAQVNTYVANIIYNLVTANRTLELPMVAGAIVVDKLVTARKFDPKVAPVILAATTGILETVAQRRGVKGRSHHGRKTEAEQEELPLTPEPEQGPEAEHVAAG